MSAELSVGGGSIETLSSERLILDGSEYGRGNRFGKRSIQANAPALEFASRTPRIVDLKSLAEPMMFFADRTNTSWLRSNQIRLYFSTVAYIRRRPLGRVQIFSTYSVELPYQMRTRSRGAR